MRTDHSNKYVRWCHAMVEISAHSLADKYFWFPFFSRMASSEKLQNVLEGEEHCLPVGSATDKVVHVVLPNMYFLALSFLLHKRKGKIRLS